MTIDQVNFSSSVRYDGPWQWGHLAEGYSPFFIISFTFQRQMAATASSLEANYSSSMLLVFVHLGLLLHYITIAAIIIAYGQQISSPRNTPPDPPIFTVSKSMLPLLHDGNCIWQLNNERMVIDVTSSSSVTSKLCWSRSMNDSVRLLCCGSGGLATPTKLEWLGAKACLSLSFCLTHFDIHRRWRSEKRGRWWKSLVYSMALAEAELVSAIADDLAKICAIVLHTAF